MTEVSFSSPALEQKGVVLPSYKKDSLSDMDGMAETQTQERTDATVTTAPSAEGSRGLTTPECDSIDVKVTAASRWSTVQEALEACLDPYFLAGQSGVKDERVAAELMQLLDSSLTVHVPALASLAFLQPLFRGSTRSERLDALLSAARASNKLVLRDDLPVPSATGWMLSVDEAEAAALRVGPRSHAEGPNRSLLTLERKHSGAECDDFLRSVTLSQLQATVPQHRIVKLEKAEGPCVVRVVFVSPLAADRAYAVWRTRCPHYTLRVTRLGGTAGGTLSSGAAAAPGIPAPAGKTLPVPPRPAADFVRPTPAGSLMVPAPRTALRCPRVIGDATSRNGSYENVNEAATAAAEKAAPVRPVVPVPKPPPAIDAGLGDAAKSVNASSGASTTNTTPSPENSAATKSKFNMNAAPFMPKSLLNAQLTAAAVGGASGAWWPRGGSLPRRSVNGEDGSVSSMDTSEALANQMLMDSTNGWMYPGLDPYSVPAWGGKYSVWAESGSGSGALAPMAAYGHDMPHGLPDASAASSSPSPPRRESPLMPERPKAVGGDVPMAPCALGDSPSAKEIAGAASSVPATTTAARSAALRPPRPVTVSLPSEMPQCGSSSYDAMAPGHVSPLSQSARANLSTSRRHRHDPYSPTGFVLCAESSCASSLSHPAGTACTTPQQSTKLLVAGSLSCERMASFCYEDPLVKASARRRERLRQQREEGEGCDETARLSQSGTEGGSSSSSLNIAHSDSAHDCSNSSSRGSESGAAAAEEKAATPAPAQPSEDVAAAVAAVGAGAAATTNTPDAAAVDVVEEEVAPVAPAAPASAPKSYAEALKLKAKAPAAAAAAPKLVVAVETKKEKSVKVAAAATASTRPSTTPERVAAHGKAAPGTAAKAAVKPKKVSAAA